MNARLPRMTVVALFAVLCIGVLWSNTNFAETPDQQQLFTAENAINHLASAKQLLSLGETEAGIAVLTKITQMNLPDTQETQNLLVEIHSLLAVYQDDTGALTSKSFMKSLGDDTCDVAIGVTLPHSEIMTVSPAGDHNWRSFPLADPTIVRIETLSSDTFGDDTDLTLWGGCDTGTPTDFIKSDDDGGPGFLSLIEICLPPGTYYTEVGGYIDIATPDDFDFMITAVGTYVVPELDEYEPDDDFATATEIGFRNNGVGRGNQSGRDNKQIQQHSIFPAADIDFLTFELSRPNYVRIETFGDENPDTVIGFYNSDGLLLAMNDDKRGGDYGSLLGFCLPRREEFFVSVQAYSPIDFFGYDIEVHVEGPCPYESEPNDTCDLANPIEPGEVWSGFQTPVDGLADDDWYSFTLEEESFVTVETDGWDDSAVDTFLELWDGCTGGALIASDDDSGPGYLSSVQAVLGPGEYYINATVSPFSIGATYPYSLTVTLSDPPLMETEPNDSCGTANPVSLGDALEASISPVGDRDHFLLSVPEDGSVEIETSGPSGDTVLQIESVDGLTVIGCDDDAGAGLFSLWGCCLPAGDYCVVVRDFGDNSTISAYTIVFRDLGTCTPDDPLACPVVGLGCPF